MTWMTLTFMCPTSWWILIQSCEVIIVKITQLCPTLYNPMDYTVPGILQAKILEWVAFSFSRGSFQPRDRTQVSHTAGRLVTSRITREAHNQWHSYLTALGQEGKILAIKQTWPGAQKSKAYALRHSCNKQASHRRSTRARAQSQSQFHQYYVHFSF